MRRRDGTNGGGTHSSARLSLCAVTGRGESIPFDIFPSCAISQIKALSFPSFVLHFGEPGSQISLKIPNYKPLKIITMTFLNNFMGWFGRGKASPISEVLPGHIPGFLGSPDHRIVCIVEKGGPLRDGGNVQESPARLAEYFSSLNKNVLTT